MLGLHQQLLIYTPNNTKPSPNYYNGEGFLFSKESVFGELAAKKFAIGDIVSWPSLDKTNSYEKIRKIGVISGIITASRSERPVIIAKVIDMETTKEVDILIICLELVSKASKEIQN